MADKPKYTPPIKITEAALVKAEKYYRKGGRLADQTILFFLRDSPMIVHGGQALNAYLPPWLDKETKDWDIFAPAKAKEYAEKLEQKLDKHYGGDYFSVEPALHLGTFRIRNNITKDVIADVSLKDRAVEFKRLKGVSYATLDYHEAHILETLADPVQSFRHKKDSETLQRIKLFKKVKKRKAQQRRREDDYLSLSGIRW